MMEDVSHWSDACLTKLEELKQLQFNWDGHDGDPPSELALDAARTIILTIAILQQAEELPGSTSTVHTAPSIVPHGSGGLQLEWRITDSDGNMELDNYIEADGTIAGWTRVVLHGTDPDMTTEMEF